jgi:hypothetical protein
MLFQMRNRKKFITKITLYTRAMKLFFGLGMSLGIFMVAMIIIVPFFTDNPLGFRESVEFGIFSIVTPLLLFTIIGSLHLLPGFLRLAKQEAFFGVRFRDEMRSAQINKTEHVSKDWFISARAAGVVVFRKGFITSVGKIERQYRRTLASRVQITTADGSNIRIEAHFETVDLLLKWQKGDLSESNE